MKVEAGVLVGAVYDGVEGADDVVEQVVDADEKLTHIFISPFDYLLRVLHLYKNDIKESISKGDFFVTFHNKRNYKTSSTSMKLINSLHSLFERVL